MSKCENECRTAASWLLVTPAQKTQGEEGRWAELRSGDTHSEVMAKQDLPIAKARLGAEQDERQLIQGSALA